VQSYVVLALVLLQDDGDQLSSDIFQSGH